MSLLTVEQPIIARLDYTRKTPTAAGWSAAEIPSDADGVVRSDAMLVDDYWLKIKLRPGDKYTSPNGYSVRRCEARRLRLLNGAGATKGNPATQWELTEGQERWLSQDIYVPAGYKTSTDGTMWTVVAQYCKGLVGGSPPVALEIKRNSWSLVHNSRDTRSDMSAIIPGHVHRMELGLFLSTTSTTGWVEMWIDGVQRLSRRPSVTMDHYTDAGVVKTDQNYPKNGLYEDGRWSTVVNPDGTVGVPHELWYGPLIISPQRLRHA